MFFKSRYCFENVRKMNTKFRKGEGAGYHL